ncbi:hypothetical protein [Acinetobacter chinensis]|uniref:hypothetical protein n=1 Tax=Acinetobacter chinensis TaxID=2004650 RepID=UPI00293522CE|nr:hypothetical protein [Acinetobacter chinensis]WOE42614.1 hypothetical protein QSG87_05660 [Acinetobacter chinensis]
MNNYLKTLLGFGVLIFIGAPTLYWYQFNYKLELPLSKSQEVWGQMGDFLGGTLNPVLTFITVFLLICSLNHQLRANLSLEEQLKTNKKNEDLRTFENSFFHLINCQNELFRNFKIEVIEENKKEILYQDHAVKKIEKVTEMYINDELLSNDIFQLYIMLNKKYNLYEVLRSFYVIVSLIDKMLSDENGFSIEDRKIYYLRLINVTTFSNLILICASVQFLKNKAISKKLKNNNELNAVMREVKISFELFKAKPKAPKS